MIFGGRILGRQRGGFQNGTGSRAIVKRDIPPGWTAVLTEGGTIRSLLARVPYFGAPYVVKLGSGAVDLPTDGKSPAQVGIR